MFASLTLIGFFSFFIWTQHAFLNQLMAPDGESKAELPQEKHQSNV